MILKEIIENIQILLYKENLQLLEKLNFEDDNTFLEPLLFTYFNSEKTKDFPKEILEEIMQGYLLVNESLRIKYAFGTHDLAYIPKKGYFDKKLNKIYDCYPLNNTSIELIYISNFFIEKIFDIAFEDKIFKEVEMNVSLFNKFHKQIENALEFIKMNCEEHFKLMEATCKQLVLFKIDPQFTNSFATIKAHGMAFINAYQEDYDEVFFIDDIAHQTGHVIMTTILFERKKFFLIDEEQNIKLITENEYEHRGYYIVLHALYTYYSIFLTLDKCIENNCFNPKQIIEAKARIGFYLKKCDIDLKNSQQVFNYYNGINNVLSAEAIEIFKQIEAKYYEIFNKYNFEVMLYKFDNQPYNFTFSNFLELNHENYV